MTNSHTFHIMLMVKGKSLYDGSKQAQKLAPILKMGQKGNWAERGGDPQHCISSGESLLSFFTQSKLRLLESGFKTRFFRACIKGDTATKRQGNNFLILVLRYIFNKRRHLKIPPS